MYQHCKGQPLVNGWKRSESIFTSIIYSGVAKVKCIIKVSIPACHMGDLGSIPRRSDRKVLSESREPVTIATNSFFIAFALLHLTQICLVASAYAIFLLSSQCKFIITTESIMHSFSFSTITLALRGRSSHVQLVTELQVRPALPEPGPAPTITVISHGRASPGGCQSQDRFLSHSIVNVDLKGRAPSHPEG